MKKCLSVVALTMVSMGAVYVWVQVVYPWRIARLHSWIEAVLS
jgi:hypothetical protein